MKSKLPIAVVCLALAATGLAAEKKSKKPPAEPSTLPPTSPMIVLPAVPEAGSKPVGTGALITTDLSGRDLQFFSTAIQAGRLQAFLVDLVKTKGEAESIKAVGAALAATQSEENKQLARLATLKGLTVPAEPPADQKKISDDLDKLSGSNFDKAAMDGIIAASRQSIAAYETAAQSGDGDIKAFSVQMLPIAQEKLRLTEKMTGAGSKAASQLFRTGAPPKAPPKATPAPATPPATAAPKPAAAASKPPATVAPAKPSATASPTKAPAATPPPVSSPPPVSTPPPVTLTIKPGPIPAPIPPPITK